ncbi:DUF177 domain-containing protein [Ruegeria sp. HKCCD8929]|uniref:YceD family protein n=1 Tax=Ruegeria sp. HKCCD8929 TaxID=2683006 RepID=UPI0014891107|nr:DUF177 domain-containing protein [Ruegeria sp. HKCCD8929]
MTDRTALRVADLPQNAPTPFDLRPDAGALEYLREQLHLVGLRKVRFFGDIRARGKRDWVLSGQLGATVLQPCVVTLDPVTTRIDTTVRRVYLANWHEPDEAETEMPEDDETEALGAEIDPWSVMEEALALALPLYPRKEGAGLGDAVFTEPGKQAITDDDAKPFAGLAGLRDVLKKDE